MLVDRLLLLVRKNSLVANYSAYYKRAHDYNYLPAVVAAAGFSLRLLYDDVALV